jgi:hypothetical protein
LPTTRFVSGSIWETVHGRARVHGLGARFSTQTKPSPATTLKGGPATSIRTPTERSPGGLVADSSPMQPNAATPTVTATSTRRRRRLDLTEGRSQPKDAPEGTADRALDRLFGTGMAPHLHRSPSRGSARHARRPAERARRSWCRRAMIARITPYRTSPDAVQSLIEEIVSVAHARSRGPFRARTGAPNLPSSIRPPTTLSLVIGDDRTVTPAIRARAAAQRRSG